MINKNFHKKEKRQSLFSASMIIPSIFRSVKMLHPRTMARNPVMFVAELSAVVTVLITIAEIGSDGAQIGYFSVITIVLWLTVIFANFAEAIAEARGRAQAESLRGARQGVVANLLFKGAEQSALSKAKSFDVSRFTQCPASELEKGDIVVVQAGEVIPADGEVVEGVASVDESAITGESAPVIRESGDDRSSVTGGTRVLSDYLIICVTAGAGESFLDRMIALVEGAERHKTPNEVALTIVLASFTLVFLFVTVSLFPVGKYFAVELDIPTLVALLVCLIPTTIGALLSAIGIAGMSRLSQANVMAMSGRAVEAAGDVSILLLDKTGTITLGNREASEFLPALGVASAELGEIAQLSSIADETPEGRSIVVLAKNQFGLRSVDIHKDSAIFIPFSARTRMSGVDINGKQIRKGSADAIRTFVESLGGKFPSDVEEAVKKVASAGGTPLVVAENNRVLGVVYLKDIVKGGIKERFAELRSMGIKTIMITGDNPITATAIAAEAGVDDFLAEATPERKLELIKEYQVQGHLVAMTGDGTNDAPALAQANVAVAMNTGTQAAKEAGNMIDLDSNPTKLLDIIAVGKQMLITRGALTTFSIANDVAKYFAIIPALFISAMPKLAPLNIMGLTTAHSAILSAVIFNAIIIPLLIPVAIRGVKYRPVSSNEMLRSNLFVYGLGGLVAPFFGIKAIDEILRLCNLI
jgi:K+-transporting ATPase ATPase B chain